MQSVSASVGILQIMLLSGVISFTPAFYIMMGMNIGASIAPILASIGGRKDAKRVAAIVVIVETLGAIFFTIFSHTTWLQMTSVDPARQMANANTIFNLVMIIITFPFAKQVVWLSRQIIRGEDKDEGEAKLEFINEAGYASTDVLIAQIDAEVRRMESLVKTNLRIATDTFYAKRPYNKEKFMKTETTIDYLNKAITDALIKASAMKLSC